MTSRRPLLPILLVLLVLPLFLAASAEEGGHGSASMDFLGKVVNSLVLFGGLAFLLRKPVKAVLARRNHEVGESLRQAEAGRAEAESSAVASKDKLAGLETEVLKLKAEAEAEAARETARIAKAAVDEAARLKKFTRQELDEQVRRSVGELRAYAAARATEIARARIRERLTPEVQTVLIDRSIDRLSKLHEKPGPR